MNTYKQKQSLARIIILAGIFLTISLLFLFAYMYEQQDLDQSAAAFAVMLAFPLSLIFLGNSLERRAEKQLRKEQKAKSFKAV